jgi:N-carbamoylputrescine amidase
VPRLVRVGLIQAKNARSAGTPAEIRSAMIEKHLPMIASAGAQGVNILCLQEIFFGPYFPAEQDAKWYALAEPVPGPTIELLQESARRHGMAIVAPIYEVEMTGVYYNTAVVIDADGAILGKYRKNHIPHLHCFWEKFYFKPGNLGYPTFRTRFGTIGVYICYDRHFPEGARILGLNGAEIVFNPSATIAGLSKYLWELEQPAHAVANGYWICAINRVGLEEPWKSGQFYGSSYVCDPRGQIVAQASETEDELLVHDVDLDAIRAVRDTWQFFRDRRPETYEGLVSPAP